MTITIYSETGRHVGHAIRRAMVEAKTCGERVTVQHNWKDFSVHPEDTEEAALAKFHTVMKGEH